MDWGPGSHASTFGGNPVSCVAALETIKLLDYVEMDLQTIANGNGYGETLRIWNFDTYVDDPQKFMETYMAHTLEVIQNNEPLNIFGWPLFLPVCIARQGTDHDRR